MELQLPSFIALLMKDRVMSSRLRVVAKSAMLTVMLVACSQARWLNSDSLREVGHAEAQTILGRQGGGFAITVADAYCQDDGCPSAFVPCVLVGSMCPAWELTPVTGWVGGSSCKGAPDSWFWLCSQGSSNSCATRTAGCTYDAELGECFRQDGGGHVPTPTWCSALPPGI